jgi:predicted metal-binding membrane protein
MGYLFPVSDFVEDHLLTHLSATETRLTGALSHPKRVALGCVAALTALGWIAVGLMSTGSPLNWQALCQPNAAGGVIELAVTAPMWMAMTLAMMLPTAGPMILTYAEIADTAARKREPVVSPLILTAGYVAVWLGFALLAASLQFALARAGLLDGGGVSRLVGGAIFLGAGLYQFSALKHGCLTLCQRPFPFFFSNWTTERSGVLRLGLRQGMLCLGCCWAMMLLMFAVGAMNVVWMASLGVLMTIEKLTTTVRFSEALGLVFVAVGFCMVVSSVW